MYESAYTTDWDERGIEEAYERSYALGVASTIGYEGHDEYVRIRDSIDLRYEKSLIELAYEEGPRKRWQSRTGKTVDTLLMTRSGTR